MIICVCDINISLRVYRNVTRTTKLTLAGTIRTKLGKKTSAAGKFLDAIVRIVRDINISCAIQRNADRRFKLAFSGSIGPKL